MKSFAVPYLFFLNYVNLLSTSKIITEKFQSLGYVQGRSAQLLHKFLGRDDGCEVFESVSGLIDLSCFGLFILDNKKNVKLKNNISFYSKFYEDNVLKIFNNHICYMYKAFYDFSFNKKTNIKFISLDTFELFETSENLELTNCEKEFNKFLTIKSLYKGHN